MCNFPPANLKLGSSSLHSLHTTLCICVTHSLRYKCPFVALRFSSSWCKHWSHGGSCSNERAGPQRPLRQFLQRRLPFESALGWCTSVWARLVFEGLTFLHAFAKTPIIIFKGFMMRSRHGSWTNKKHPRRESKQEAGLRKGFQLVDPCS